MSSKVLTVDDSKTLRMIVRGTLLPFGVKVIEAENGAVGLDKARAESPDLILLDFNMPVMDGQQTLENLKRDPKCKDIPVIMLTTESAQETVVTLLKIGLSGYVVKPFKKEDLLVKVNELLHLYEGDEPPGEEELKQLAKDAGKVSILAVDDKENVLNLLEQHFGEEFKFEKATSGTEAMMVIERVQPDVLFLDVDMPGTDGIDVYNSTSNALRKKGTLVYAMALRTEDKDIARAKQVGMKVLLKPFDQDEMNDVILAIRQASGQGGAAGTPQAFLETQGKAKVLVMPGAGDPRLRSFGGALAAKIPAEVKDMAEEGCSELVVEVSGVLASDVNLAKSFIQLLTLARKLSIKVRLVAGSEEAKQALNSYAETSSLPACDSLEEALASFA